MGMIKNPSKNRSWLSVYVIISVNMAEEKKPYLCEWCGSSYTTRQALSRHKKTCEAKPDREEDDEEQQQEQQQTGGFNLFGDDGDVDSSSDDDDYYICGNCDHRQKKKFTYCPECGVLNEW